MVGFLLRLVISAFALWVASAIVPGVSIVGTPTLLAAALLLGIVNAVLRPLALLMSAVMMLNHLAETERDARHRDAATRIRGAYDAALRAGTKTRDVGGSLGTRAFADAIISRL